MFERWALGFLELRVFVCVCARVFVAFRMPGREIEREREGQIERERGRE